jgi:hypothetical protein
MGCGGSKTATPAPAPGLLKEDKKQQEAKSKTLKEYVASLQNATDADIEATIVALDADARQKLLEALSATKPAEDLPTKTIAENETASPVEFEAAPADNSTDNCNGLQEAMAPPVQESKMQNLIALEEEEPEKATQQTDLKQATAETAPRTFCCY